MLDGMSPELPARFDDEVLDRLKARLTGLPRRRLREAGARSAAVLVPFCHVEGAPSVLFTKRSDTVGTHKGQVSFPGGMADEDDEGPEHTALRELEEEIGFPAGQVAVLGPFHEALSITGVRVVPVLGFLGDVDLTTLEPSQAEIDHVFALSLRDLIDPEKRYDQMLGDRGPNPVFDAGPFPVWGLTAWILKEVLQDVLGHPLGPGRG